MDDEQLHRLLADAEPPTPTQDLAVLASLADLNRRVAAQARAESAGSATGSTTGSAAATSHTTRTPEQASARRGRRHAHRATRVTALALAATVATGAAAAAAFHVARTGIFGQAGMTENDTTEWLDPSGQDFPAVAAALAPAYVTYAPPADAASATGWVVAVNRREQDVRVQETGVARNYAAYGQCSWVAAWETTTAGSPERATATAQLTSSAGWPVFAATDGDGGVTASMNALAAAASRGDGVGVAQIGSTLCDEQLLAELGDGADGQGQR